MFISELFPIFKELWQQPLAFTGGFFSGMLRLSFQEEPLASWLSKQGFDPSNPDISIANNSNKPQSIEID